VRGVRTKIENCTAFRFRLSENDSEIKEYSQIETFFDCY